MSAQHDLSASVVGPGEGRSLIPGGVLLKVSGQQTGGALEVLELSGLGGPPPHVHRAHDELWYVTQGRLEFTIGEDKTEVAAGSVVFVPRGIRHAFTPGPNAKALVFVMPAGLEGFFQELGARTAAGATPEETRHMLEARYDSHPA